MNCQNIKQKVGIRSVLESFGIFPVRENPKTAFYFALDREEKISSLSVDFVKNKAFDFGNGKSYDVISIVQLIKKCSVSEALKYLSTLDFSVQNELKYHETIEQTSNQILEIKEIQHPALIQYLKSRKVYEQNHLVKEIHYQLKGRKYFGIGFQNNSGGFEIRNLHSKICLGKKDVTLIVNDKKSKNEIVVFEGFFDYLTYRNLEKSDNSNCDFLILNSIALLRKNIELINKYESIQTYFDHDDAGKSATIFLETELKTKVKDDSNFYKKYKDLNEFINFEK